MREVITAQTAAPEEYREALEQIQQTQEAQRLERYNQQTTQREILVLLRSTTATLRSIAARESQTKASAKEAAKAAERAARQRRRKAVKCMILAWLGAAAVCIGAWIIRAEDMAAANVVYFVNAAAVAAAMYISGYLHGWGWSGGGKL